MLRVSFDPRGSVPLALTLAAVMAFWLWLMPGLGAVSTYRELRAAAPTKDLLQESLIARALAEPGGPPTWSCQLCSVEGTRGAWRELQMLLDQYDDAPPFVRDARAGLDRAKAISLASWGDRESLALVPDPQSALGPVAVAGSAYDALAGVRAVEPSRVHRVGWLSVGLEFFAILLGLPLFLRWRRLTLPVRPWAFGAAQGVFLFMWWVGAASLVYGAADWLSWRDILSEWYPLPDALAALVIARSAFAPGSWGALARGLGLGGVALRPVASFGLIALSASLAWSWAITIGGDSLGHVQHWADGAGGVLVNGADGEKLQRWLSLVVIGPLYEELLFTGLLFGGLVQRFSFRAAALVTGGVFALHHAYDLVGSLDLLVGSMLSCWAYFRCGSLWPSVFAHGLLNASFAAVVFY